MKRSALPLAFLLLLSPTWARLGEKEPELVARFGPPVMRSKHVTMAHGKVLDLGPSLHFRQETWSIVSDLVDDRVVREHYSKPGEWTTEQLQAVLAANSQGATWTETGKSGSKMSRTWKRSDGGTASWSVGAGVDFTSPAYNRAKEVAESKAKAAASRTPKI